MSLFNALLGEAVARLGAAGVESPGLDVRLLLAKAMGTTRERLLTGPEPSPTEREIFDGFIRRRESREPLAYITGAREFWSLEFEIGPGVLVPRPESETLIEQAFQEFPARERALEILDLGTGSGCLLISALHEFAQGRGLGIDASADALGYARRNREKHGLASRCEMRLGNWDSVTGIFDLILANPPYIATGDLARLAPELGFEPRSALDGGADGLDDLRALAPVIARLLKPEGRAFIEIGADQGAGIQALFALESLEVSRIAPDLAGKPRCAVLKWAKKPLEIRGSIR